MRRLRHHKERDAASEPLAIDLPDIARRAVAGDTIRLVELTSLRSACWMAGSMDDELSNDPVELAAIWRSLGRPDQSGRPTATATPTELPISDEQKENV